MNVNRIMVIIEVDGNLCLAPIKAEAADIFLGMLPVFQSDSDKPARLLKLPPPAIEALKEFDQEMLSIFNAARGKS